MKKSNEMKLVGLVEKFIEGIDEEMEHGCYSAPDGVPYEYDSEEDYYGTHEKIVWKNVEIRNKMKKLISKIKKENN